MWWLERVATIRKKIDQLEGHIESYKGDTERTMSKMRAENTALADDNKRYSKANRELNAKANGIKIPKSRTQESKDKEHDCDKQGVKAVSALDTPKSKRRGRPPGQPATINRRPEKIDRVETVDCTKCPKDAGHTLSEKPTSTFSRVVNILHVYVETVKFVRNRRYCRDCKQQVYADIPGVAPYARTSANHSAIAVALNMSGLSHGKIAKFSTEALNSKMSRSWSYRNKIATSNMLAAEYDMIRQKILEEPYLLGDEFHWPVPMPPEIEEKLGLKGGHALVALGRGCGIVLVSYDRAIPTLQKFLPNYDGIIGQDSYPAWFHVGSDHQMCLLHQIRIAKKDLKYKNPKGDVKEFLERYVDLLWQYYRARLIKGKHTRMVAANCLNSLMRELINRDWKDDGDHTIQRYKKRWKREGWFVFTFLAHDYVDADSNAIERVNRGFVSIRNDGGGNRSPNGMKANSILFTILVTCKVQNKSFYEHIKNALGHG